MSVEFKFKNGSYIKAIEPNKNKRPTNIEFKEITENEIAQIFGISLEEFRKEVREGKIKSWA